MWWRAEPCTSHGKTHLHCRDVGSILYQSCLKDAAWLPNICNGEFIFCSYANSHLEGQAILVLTYMLIPSAALLLMLVIHLLVLIFANFSAIQAQEDVELRRAVWTRTASLQERLQNDQLDGSLWWSRRTLEAKLCFFLSDIVLDMICCVNFFRAEAYAFGGCQLVILAFSGILQLKVGFSSTWKAVCKSLRQRAAKQYRPSSSTSRENLRGAAFFVLPVLCSLLRERKHWCFCGPLGLDAV